ncbi:MAG: 6-phosphogluconolactonase [Robiginitomaculum sp.]|nr:MAG: 6-phosphogluconolactonase [Robiginitomaculum sp.]
MSPHIQHFSDISDLHEHATNLIITQLKSALDKNGVASLMVSGGSTPGPVYSQISHFDLPWKDITIGLVDERWVDEDDTGSNARLVRNTLLQNKASFANFIPMKTSASTPQDGQLDVEANHKNIPSPFSVVVLGMGSDGHTASWFPKAEGLDAALSLDNTNMVQAITAQQTGVTGAYLNRMTLTRHALDTCDFALLLVTGAEKKKVFEAALAGDDYPIRSAIDTLGERLHVFIHI